MSNLEDAGGFGEYVPPAEIAKPGIGHNVTDGLRHGDDLEKYLRVTHAKVLKRAADLLEAGKRLPAVIQTPEQDAAATEFVKQIQACVKALDGARTNELEPYDTAKSLVHNLFRIDMDALAKPNTKGAKNGLKETVEAKQTAYKLDVLEKERKRLREEAEIAARVEGAKRFIYFMEMWSHAALVKHLEGEAEKRAEAARGPKTNAAAEISQQIADEARSRLAQAAEQGSAALDEASNQRAIAETRAAAPAADLTRERGGRGGVSSLKEFVNFRNILRAKINLEELRPFLKIDAIEGAIRLYMNANNDTIRSDIANSKSTLDGVTFFINHKTGNR